MRRVPGRSRHGRRRAPYDQQGRRRVRRRRGIAELPASVARFRIWTAAHDGRRLGEGLVVTPDCARPPRCPSSRSERRSAATTVSSDLAVELGDALDVDHDPRPDRPVAKADDQVGAAGQQPRLGVRARPAGRRRPRGGSAARTRRVASTAPRALLDRGCQPTIAVAGSAAGLAASSRRISTLPAVPSTLMRSPVAIRWVATDVPMTAGMPNSRDEHGRMRGRAAGVGHEAGDLREQHDPGRIRHLADEDVAVTDLVELVDGAHDAGDPLDHAGDPPMPVIDPLVVRLRAGRSGPGSPS